MTEDQRKALLLKLNEHLAKVQQVLTAVKTSPTVPTGFTADEEKAQRGKTKAAMRQAAQRKQKMLQGAHTTHRYG